MVCLGVKWLPAAFSAAAITCCSPAVMTLFSAANAVVPVTNVSPATIVSKLAFVFVFMLFSPFLVIFKTNDS